MIVISLDDVSVKISHSISTCKKKKKKIQWLIFIATAPELYMTIVYQSTK